MALLGLAGVFGALSPNEGKPGSAADNRSAFVDQRVVESSGSCDIKCNISARGERIYHLPGQEYYGRTRIDTGKGERYFCSEGEARAAGWRRSKV